MHKQYDRCLFPFLCLVSFGLSLPLALLTCFRLWVWSAVQMARKDVKESVLDTQLIYALARVNKLAELEELISVPNVAKIDQIGERCFDEVSFPLFLLIGLDTRLVTLTRLLFLSLSPNFGDRVCSRLPSCCSLTSTTTRSWRCAT